MTPNYKQGIASLVTLAIALAGISQPAQAAIITTEQAAASPAARARLSSALQRPEVARKLTDYGVSKSDAEARLAALTDEEASMLAARLDTAPAGGDFFATLGIIVVLLVVTDLLGVTDIFPFINSVR